MTYPSSIHSSSQSFERLMSSINDSSSGLSISAAFRLSSGTFETFFHDLEQSEIRNIDSLRDSLNLVNSRAASELARSTAVEEAVILCFQLQGSGTETHSFA